MRNTGWKVARAASFLLYYSGGLRLFERADRGKRPAPRCTVLSYHRVADDRPGYRDISVSPATFRGHIAYLRRRGYGFLSLSEYHDYLSGARRLDRDSVLITFDDGYRDNYVAAFPVLREFGIPAAVFLCTDPIETGSLLWWDRVAGAVRALRDAGGSAPPVGPDLPVEVAAALRAGLEGDTSRVSAAIGDVVDLLKAKPVEERERTISALERLAPRAVAGATADGGLMLTWGMVREMHAAGICFGAHSVTHASFSRLSAEEARAEISGSVSAIEREIGEAPVAFAYPYGKEDFIGSSTADALRASGIRWAYTTQNGWNAPGADPLALRRNGMRDVPAYVLAARVAGVFEHPAFARLRSRVEGRSAK